MVIEFSCKFCPHFLFLKKGMSLPIAILLEKALNIQHCTIKYVNSQGMRKA